MLQSHDPSHFKPAPEQIEAWVVAHFPRHKRRKNGEEYDIANPFDLDTGMHLGINTRKAKCHDWRPGHQRADGSFIRFVQKYRGISYQEAIREVCGADVDLRKFLESDDRDEPPTNPSIVLPGDAVPFSADEIGPIRNLALAYLESRGVNETKAEQFRLLYTPDSIIFPYYEYEELVYWQSRSMLNKTFNFPDEAICGVKKSQFVFGFDFVEPCTEIVIVESIFNMFALGENVVASGGADILGTQIKKVLALRPERVILAPDNDEAGTKSLFHNFFLIESMTSVPVWYCLPPKGQSKDWSEIGERLGWDQPRNLYQQGLKRLDQAELISLGCHR